MMKYTIAAIPHYLIDFMWPFVENIISSIIAKAHGEMNLDTVKAKLKSDNALMILCLDGRSVKSLVILQVEVFDTGLRVLNVSMAGGSLDIFCGDYDEVLIAISKDLNCSEIRAIGARVGWEIQFKKSNPNWEKLSTTLIYKVEQ